MRVTMPLVWQQYRHVHMGQGTAAFPQAKEQRFVFKAGTKPPQCWLRTFGSIDVTLHRLPGPTTSPTTPQPNTIQPSMSGAGLIRYHWHPLMTLQCDRAYRGFTSARHSLSWLDQVQDPACGNCKIIERLPSAIISSPRLFLINA